MQGMSKHKKVYITCIAVLLVILAVLFVYQRTQADKGARTTSKESTAQSDYSGGRERPSSHGSSQGAGIDTGGRDTPATDDQGVSSESGAITVLSPTVDAVFDSGTVIAGKTEGVSRVQYRVIDEVSGVVVQGNLAVVDGSFSGKIQFNAQSKAGRLDVFSFDASGSEINNIEIPVRFKE